MARTNAWRKANEGNEGNPDEDSDNYRIPRSFNPEVEKAWNAFDIALNDLNSKKDSLPSFEFQQENDLVFVTLKYEADATRVYDKYRAQVESQEHLSEKDLSAIDDCFKWTNEEGNVVVLSLRRARDEPNALYWENVVIEEQELVVADRIVKSVIFISVGVCFILLYFLLR